MKTLEEIRNEYYQLTHNTKWLPQEQVLADVEELKSEINKILPVEILPQAILNNMVMKAINKILLKRWKK